MSAPLSPRAAKVLDDLRWHGSIEWQVLGSANVEAVEKELIPAGLAKYVRHLVVPTPR